MKTKALDVKTSLKNLRTSQEVFTEMKVLREVRGCYNHFLASLESNEMKVAAVQVQLNKIAINKALNELQLELDAIQAEIKLLTPQPTTKRYTYRPTESEDRAIMLFNSDKRFKITE